MNRSAYARTCSASIVGSSRVFRPGAHASNIPRSDGERCRERVRVRVRGAGRRRRDATGPRRGAARPSTRLEGSDDDGGGELDVHLARRLLLGRRSLVSAAGGQEGGGREERRDGKASAGSKGGHGGAVRIAETNPDPRKYRAIGRGRAVHEPLRGERPIPMPRSRGSRRRPLGRTPDRRPEGRARSLRPRRCSGSRRRRRRRGRCTGARRGRAPRSSASRGSSRAPSTERARDRDGARRSACPDVRRARCG